MIQNLSQPTILSQELYLFGHLTSRWLVERGQDHLLLSSFPFFKSPVLQNDKGSGLCHSWSAHEIKAFHGLKYFISPNYKILYGYEGTYFEISIWRNSWSGDSWIYWKVGKWETGQWLKRWCLDNPRDISNDGSINMTTLDRRPWKKGWRPSIKTAFIFIRIQHMRRLHNSWLGTSSIALKTTSLQYKYVNMRSNIFMINPAQRMINMQMCEILWDHPGWRLIEWDQHLEDGGNVF